jgi:tight adherence protein B
MLIVAALVAALLLTSLPGMRQAKRFQRALAARGRRDEGNGPPLPGRETVPSTSFRLRKQSRVQGNVPMTVVVQQLAALLKGGRTPSRLWDELSAVYPDNQQAVGNSPGRVVKPGHVGKLPGHVDRRVAGGRHHGSDFQLILAAARAASLRGAPVSDAIRSATSDGFASGSSRDRRIWDALAACFDIAEASGCPLADLLTRFAAQLEAEDDAEAARQTALAGPKATVRLLTWLPFLGLGLGLALGVDPLKILLATPYGLAALLTGIALTLAGRVWSARLVRIAAGAP